LVQGGGCWGGKGLRVGSHFDTPLERNQMRLGGGPRGEKTQETTNQGRKREGGRDVWTESYAGTGFLATRNWIGTKKMSTGGGD